MLNAYIQILFHNSPLDLVAQICVGKVPLQVIQCLTRVEVHLRFLVHGLVVYFGRLRWGIFLDFAVMQTKGLMAFMSRKERHY